MKKKFITFCLMLLVAYAATACKVDTLLVHSAAMKKNVSVSVVLPDSYGEKRMPVAYLLHGYGDSNLNGFLNKTHARQLADALGMILVIPDGDTSWYFDSPVDSAYRYETFVAKELVAYVDSCFLTVADRRGRAITGLSMGGHGALYLAIRHQVVFGAAGSMSGGVDFRPFPDNWDIKKRLGDKSTHPDNWERNTVIAQLPRLKDGALQLIIDCGTEDFFYQVNLDLHNRLTERKIGHEFTTRPGNHNWTYWNRSIRDHLLFFYDYFNSSATK